MPEKKVTIQYTRSYSETGGPLWLKGSLRDVTPKVADRYVQMKVAKIYLPEPVKPKEAEEAPIAADEEPGSATDEEVKVALVDMANQPDPEPEESSEEADGLTSAEGVGDPAGDE